MKNLHHGLYSLKQMQRFFFSLLLLGICLASQAQMYTASLKGSSEAPPNNSPGTGSAIITITGTNMRVQASFSGLVGTTTASHIHAPTAAPGTGTAGVATTTPLFTGFPVGVTSGTYDHNFDMTLASSYNASYITANGGTTATAFAALKAALNNGTSYFNIHSTAFPGGEIRGFLVACPALSVSIPDAFALPQGVLPNTVYPAYAPAASLTLEAMVSGGTTPYTYSWSGGSATSSITVSPTVSTAYTVSVTDMAGCKGSATTTVGVANIAGGKKGDKIVLCHKERNTLTIDGTSVADHLAHGDMLGSCPESAIAEPGAKLSKESAEVLAVRVYQNPSTNYFDLKINGRMDKKVQVNVYDLQGRKIEAKTSVQPNSMVRIGLAYSPGTYIVEVTQGTEKQVLKLMKQ